MNWNSMRIMLSRRIVRGFERVIRMMLLQSEVDKMSHLRGDFYRGLKMHKML